MPVPMLKVLRTKIYEKLLSLGMSYRSQVATSNAVQLSVEGVEQLEVYFSNYLPQFFYSLLAPITLFIIYRKLILRPALFYWYVYP